MSHDARVDALDGLLEDAGLDAVLATKDASIAYLTGFWGLQMERFFGVAVRRGGAGALIAPRSTATASAPRRPGSTRRSTTPANPTACPSSSTTLGGAKRIGVEEDHLIFARSKALQRGGLRARPGDRR